LRITGKTRNEAGAALDISLDADIETLIKVASFEVVYSTDNGSTFQSTNEYGFKAGLSYISFLVPSQGIDNVKLLNTGNTPLKIKLRRNYTGVPWEETNIWETIEPGNYSNLFTDMSGTSEYYFFIDTIGITFNNNGINDLGFRPGSSIVHSTINYGYNLSIMVFSK